MTAWLLLSFTAQAMSKFAQRMSYCPGVYPPFPLLHFFFAFPLVAGGILSTVLAFVVVLKMVVQSLPANPHIKVRVLARGLGHVR